MFRKLIALAAWGCLIFIIYATLSSAGARPELTRASLTSVGGLHRAVWGICFARTSVLFGLPLAASRLYAFLFSVAPSFPNCG